MEEKGRANRENSKILTGIRDLDLLILQNLDDRSVLNFLATNKDLYTDENIALIFGRRYPQLLKFKRPDESLKGLYLRMLKYIGLLREKFGIVYTKGEQENPILAYGFKKYKTKNLNNLLIRASKKGDLEIVRTSLEAGANIRENQNEALRAATMYGHLHVIKHLVERGEDIRADDNWALRFASEMGHLSVVQYLVEAGANVNAQDDEALRRASRSGHLPIVKYLVEAGANIRARNDEALIWASTKGYLPIVQYLVERGANIHAQNDYALKWANYYGYLPVVKYLKSLN